MSKKEQKGSHGGLKQPWTTRGLVKATELGQFLVEAPTSLNHKSSYLQFDLPLINYPPKNS